MKKLFIILIVMFSVSCASYKDSVKNPENSEFVNEIAFNLDCKPEQVKQEWFKFVYYSDKSTEEIKRFYEQTNQIFYVDTCFNCD